MPGYHVVDGKRATRLKIKLDSGEESELLVNFCSDKTVIDAVNNLGRSLPPKGNCDNSRKGELGGMWGFGVRNSTTGVEYVTAAGREELLLEASRRVADWAEEVMSDVVADIRRAETKKGGQQPAYIDARVGKSTMLSRDYGNACHIDYNDASMSCGLFTEVISGDAKNWYFVLPHCSYNGSLGIVIQLHSGTDLAWDGRVIRHNTAVTSMHPNNNTFGIMYAGSCR
jgi:hypothetical protein